MPFVTIRILAGHSQARKDEMSHKSSSGLETWLREMKNCTVIQGHARFVSPREVEVGSERLTAPQIFINVGGETVGELKRTGRL